MEENGKNVLDEHGQPIVRTPAVLQQMGTRIKTLAFAVSAVLALIAGIIISLKEIDSFVSEKISYIRSQEIPTVLIEPIQYFPDRHLNDLNPAVSRPQPKGVPGILTVDAVVSQLHQIYYVDLRLVNQSDSPLLVSSVRITAKEVKPSKEIVVTSSREDISQVYDIDISNLLHPGDKLTQPLIQLISSKETDRFVFRMTALNFSGRLVFDIEVTTSASIIFIKEQSVEFEHEVVYCYGFCSSKYEYLKELDALADRRSADLLLGKAVQTDWP